MPTDDQVSSEGRAVVDLLSGIPDPETRLRQAWADLQAVEVAFHEACRVMWENAPHLSPRLTAAKVGIPTARFVVGLAAADRR